jgi:hypothetical protein
MLKSILSAAGSAIETLITATVLTRLSKILEPTESASAEVQDQVERSVKSQLLAAAIFARWGVSGLASAYHLGLISVAEFAAYVVMGEAYRLPATSNARIAQIEGEAQESDVIGTLLGTFHLDESATNPQIIAQMYTYLLAKRAFN